MVHQVDPQFSQFDAFIFDLDGTIYLGEQLIPGADTTIKALRAAGKNVVFLSNKPLEQRIDYAKKLTQLGIPTSENEVINSAYVLGRYLAKTHTNDRIYVTGEPPLLEEFREHNLHVLTEDEAISGPVDVVVASFDRTLTYKKLQAAFEGLKKGARFYATNPDKTCPVENGELPDAAGVIAFLEATTDRRVELIAGKPNPLMAEAAAEIANVPYDRCLMVGDRLETDMYMGLDAGMSAATVLSGITTEDEAKTFADSLGEKKDRLYIIPSVASLISPAP